MLRRGQAMLASLTPEECEAICKRLKAEMERLSIRQAVRAPRYRRGLESGVASSPPNEVE